MNTNNWEEVKELPFSAEELKNASWDARLELTGQEEEELREQLQAFFQVAQGALQDADLKEVKASYYAITKPNVLRKDKIEPSLPLSLTLANAPDADDYSFNVPKIVEE